jgi:hypothetical protein
MTFFFSSKKSPGRPAKKTPKSGRPAAKKGPGPGCSPGSCCGPKATRTSYSKGEGLMKMTNSEAHDIPFTTLQTHITPNDSKRIKLGRGVGRKPFLDDQREAIIVDVFIRKDRANEGASVGEAVEILEQMCPEYSRKQLD